MTDYHRIGVHGQQSGCSRVISWAIHGLGTWDEGTIEKNSCSALIVLTRTVPWQPEYFTFAVTVHCHNIAGSGLQI